MDRFFSSPKSEWIHDRIFSTFESATTAIFEYIETFYNLKQRHQTLGYQLPIRYENKMNSDQELSIDPRPQI
jgi:putative transposase